jgi:hypothetical protein
MLHRTAFASFIALIFVATAAAQEVQTDPQTGQQYQITGRQIWKKPVSDTHIEERPYTVYTDRSTTEYHPTYQTVLTPVTEYQWEPYMAGRWNPFSSPHVEYKYVPHTRWDSRTEEVHIPVVKHDLVPEQRVMRVPVVTQRWVDEEHITRVPVSQGSTMASTSQIGGVANLQNDPPRQPNTLSSVR